MVICLFPEKGKKTLNMAVRHDVGPLVKLLMIWLHHPRLQSLADVLLASSQLKLCLLSCGETGSYFSGGYPVAEKQI